MIQNEKYAVKINNLSFSIGRNRIINDLNINIKEKEKVLIKGRNGSGKTTLIKLILGLLKPDKGNIRTNPDNPSSIAYINQESINIDYPVSAMEVVQIGKAASLISHKNLNQITRQAMNQTNTIHLAHRSYPTLSGGEKQKISLARALVQKADIILLDEPTSSLDLEATGEVLNIIEKMDTTILMVSHDIAAASRQDWRELTMEKGTLK